MLSMGFTKYLFSASSNKFDLFDIKIVCRVRSSFKYIPVDGCPCSASNMYEIPWFKDVFNLTPRGC